MFSFIEDCVKKSNSSLKLPTEYVDNSDDIIDMNSAVCKDSTRMTINIPIVHGEGTFPSSISNSNSDNELDDSNDLETTALLVPG